MALIDEAVVIAVIAAIPPTMVAAAALRKSVQVAAQTHAIHLEINSRMDQLLELTKSSSHAEGIEHERVRGLLDPAKRMEVEVHMPKEDTP